MNITTHEQDAQIEEQQTASEAATSEIVVTRNQDGTHTGRSGKQSHTTRRINWDNLLD